MKTTAIFALMSLVSASALAATNDTASLCSLNAARPGEKVLELDFQPSYFISTNPVNSDLVGVIHSSTNWIIDLNGRRPEELHRDRIQVPGYFDPVYTPDGLMVTVSSGPFSFYPTHEFMKAFDPDQPGDHAMNVTPLIVDSELSGAYQSIGMPRGYQPRRNDDGSFSTVYRVIIENNATIGGSTLGVRDYTVTYDADGQFIGEQREEQVSVLCPDHKLKTPRLSKSGHYLAAYDFDAQITKLFRIGEIVTVARRDQTERGLDLEFGHDSEEEEPLVQARLCEEVKGVDLGMHTGKVDFNFDDSMITYHISRYESLPDNEGTWPVTISSGEKRDLYVMKLTKDQKGHINGVESFQKITPPGEFGEGGWYPSFAADGKLVYMASIKNASHQLVNALVQVDPTTVSQIPYTYAKANQKVDEAPRIHAFHALSALAAETCQWPSARSFDENLADALSLQEASCHEMVTSLWPARRTAILASDALHRLTQEPKARLIPALLARLSTEDLLAACPSWNPSTPTVSVSAVVREIKVTGHKVLASCNYCHYRNQGVDDGWGVRQLNFENLGSFSFDDLTLSIHSMEYVPQPELYERIEDRMKEISRRMPLNDELDDTRKRAALCVLYRERHERFPASSPPPGYCEAVE